MTDPVTDTDAPPRHGRITRLWHWLNAGVMAVMLMSGLMIFNAHPRLYWGSYGADPDPAWFEIGARDGSGFLRVGTWSFDTTGWLGLWTDGGGAARAYAFPEWITMPGLYDLAGARAWHFTFGWAFGALVVGYALWSLAGHLWRDLLPRPRELAPRHLGREVVDHARLRFQGPGGGYNTLQKLAYLGVLCVLLPVMILSGLAMSPAMDAAWPWLLDLFGGRQSARSAHFIAMVALVVFFVVHVVLVLLSGPIWQMRAMITGGRRP